MAKQLGEETAVIESHNTAVSSSGGQVLARLHDAALDVVEKVYEFGFQSQEPPPRSPRELRPRISRADSQEEEAAAEVAAAAAADELAAAERARAYYHAKLLDLAVRMSHDFVVKFMPNMAESSRLKELTTKFEAMLESSSVMAAAVGGAEEEEARWVLANVKKKAEHEDLYQCYTEQIWEAKTAHQAKELTDALATGKLVYVLFCHIINNKNKRTKSKRDKKSGRREAVAAAAAAVAENPGDRPAPTQAVTWYGLAKVGHPFQGGRAFPLVWQTQVTFATSESQLKEQLTRLPDEDRKDFKKRKNAFMQDRSNFETSRTAKGVEQPPDLQQLFGTDRLHHFFWMSPEAGRVVQAWLRRQLPAAPLIPPPVPRTVQQLQDSSRLGRSSSGGGGGGGGTAAAGMSRSLSLSRLPTATSQASSSSSTPNTTSAGPPGTPAAAVMRLASSRSSGGSSSGGDALGSQQSSCSSDLGGAGGGGGHFQATDHFSGTIVLRVQDLRSEGYTLPSAHEQSAAGTVGALAGTPVIDGLTATATATTTAIASSAATAATLAAPVQQRPFELFEAELERKFAKELGVDSHRLLCKGGSSVGHRGRGQLWVGARGGTRCNYGVRIEPVYHGTRLLAARAESEDEDDPLNERVSVPFAVYSDSRSNAARLGLRLLEGSLDIRARAELIIGTPNPQLCVVQEQTWFDPPPNTIENRGHPNRDLLQAEFVAFVFNERGPIGTPLTWRGPPLQQSIRVVKAVRQKQNPQRFDITFTVSASSADLCRWAAARILMSPLSDRPREYAEASKALSVFPLVLPLENNLIVSETVVPFLSFPFLSFPFLAVCLSVCLLPVLAGPRPGTVHDRQGGALPEQLGLREPGRVARAHRQGPPAAAAARRAVRGDRPAVAIRRRPVQRAAC
eukprot:SAG22_NODE_212_length_15072_cov_3.109197_14_plen_905_part_00